MKNFFSITCLFFLFACGAFAQISQGGKPLSSGHNYQKSAAISKIVLPSIDIIELLKEDREESSKDVPQRFAYAHQVNLNPLNSGKWFTDADGNKFWMLQVESKGARSLNITFSDFYIPEGAKLFLYNPDKSDIKGAFTSENNKTSRKLGIAPIKGDNLIIEYYQPKNVQQEPALHIATVAHDYRGIYTMAKDFGDSGSCNVNIGCEVGNNWKNQSKSVAMYTLSNGTRWCSGALINNTNDDGTPYFLTANHCLRDDIDAWVFYFNYESPDCNDRDGQLNQSISGSELIATDPESDFLLLKLSSTPPSNYNIYYSGWNATDEIPANGTSIHHPTGDIKKISIRNEPLTISGYLGDTGSTHWQIDNWDVGTTEGGSSGSPLYDQNKRIVGQLHGGYAACNNNEGDWYGRFSVSFPNMSQWLAPQSTALIVDGYDPNQDVDACNEVVLTLTFDNYPDETSWEIINSNEEIVASGGLYPEQEIGSTLEFDFCLEDGCYQLVFRDSYGDGICCGYGLGSYQLKDEIGLLAFGAAFAEIEEKNFCVGSNRVTAEVSENKENNLLSDPLAALYLFPNPVSNILNIGYRIKSDSSITTQLIDFTGRVIRTQTFNINNPEIDVNQLPEGTYFLRVIENKAIIVKKFVVIK